MKRTRTSQAYGLVSALALALVSFMLSLRPSTAQALGSKAWQISPVQNLTNDSAQERWPAVTQTSTGDIVVAWEQDVPIQNQKPKQQIYARIGPNGGSFNPAFTVSDGSKNAREPSLFNATSGVSLLYYQLIPNQFNYDISSAILNNGIASTPTRLVNSPTASALDPVGVQASDGQVWYLWQQGGGGTRTDAEVMLAGGKQRNLSNDGSAARHPSITAGANGNVYLAWVDHANESPGIDPGIKVRQWDGTRWKALRPDPTTDPEPTYPGLAFANGNLYLVWRTSTAPYAVKERIWNGSKWSAPTTLVRAYTVNSPRIFVPASGNVFVAWARNGAIYIQKNGSTPVVVSTGVPAAANPSLFVDNNDIAYIVFQNGKGGGDIWYVTAQ